MTTRRRFFFHAELCQRLVAANHHAASRCFAASARAAQFNRLARYHRRRCLPVVHRVCVHHPGHRLLARAHIRRGNIALRPKPIDQLGGIAPRQTLQFAARHLARITDNSALRPAKRNIHHRTLPRHPRRQRAHFIQRNVRRKSNSALARSAHRRMKHAIPGENLQVAVVQSHRNVQRDLLARIFQIPVNSLLQTQLLRRYLKTRFRVLVDIHLFRAGSCDMRDSPYSLHTPAQAYGFAGFNIPVFKIVDCKAQTVEFGGLPTRRACHLAGKAVYEAIQPPRKPPPITVWKLFAHPARRALSASKIVPSRFLVPSTTPTASNRRSTLQ